MRMPDGMSENMSKKCRLAVLTRSMKVICSEGFQKLI